MHNFLQFSRLNLFRQRMAPVKKARPKNQQFLSKYSFFGHSKLCSKSHLYVLIENFQLKFSFSFFKATFNCFWLQRLFWCSAVVGVFKCGSIKSEFNQPKIYVKDSRFIDLDWPNLCWFFDSASICWVDCIVLMCVPFPLLFSDIDGHHTHIQENIEKTMDGSSNCVQYF